MGVPGAAAGGFRAPWMRTGIPAAGMLMRFLSQGGRKEKKGERRREEKRRWRHKKE